MKYSVSCPPPCSHTMSVESESEEDAVIRLSREARAHMEKAHSDMPRMSDDEIKGIVRSEMKKG